MKMNFSASQLEAINLKDSNILVSAGAGSGKTTVLSGRVMRILEDGGNISRLLILTFTNNAAHNMREKIKKDIIKSGVHLDQLNLVDASDIVTYDSFNQKLIRKYFYKLGISSSFSIVDSNLLGLKLNEFIDDSFEKLYDSNNRLFISLLDRYTNYNDDDIKLLVKNIFLSISSRLNPEYQFSKLIDSPAIDNKVIVFSYEKILNKAKNILEISNNIFDKCDDNDEVFCDVKAKFKKIYSDYIDIDNIDEFLKIKEAFENAKLRKKSKGSTDFNDFYEDFKKSKTELLSFLSTIPSFSTTCQILTNQTQYLKLIYEISYDVYKKMEVYKNNMNAYTFDDISNFVNKLLRENEDIREEIKNQYDEILVDEYQDNNDIQEEFLNMISNDNLFMVGDVKQSIYNFRKSNPRYFISRFDKYKKNLGGKLVDLSENFRSDSNVISDINDIFSKIMFSSFGGAEYKKEHIIKFGSKEFGKFVSKENRLFIYDDGRKSKSPNIELEAKIIAKDIIERINSKEKIKNNEISFKDFTIMCDRGSKFDIISRVFESYHIPLRIDVDQETSSSLVSALVKNLLKLYRCVLNNDFVSSDFKLSLLVISRGYIGKYSIEKLHKTFLLSDISKDEIVCIMKEIVTKVKNLSINSIYREIKDRFNLIEILSVVDKTLSSYQYIINFDDIFSNMDALHFSIDDAINYFETSGDKDAGLKQKINISPLSDTSVVLTNIHKSKGLEYNIVYYIGLSTRYNNESSKDKFCYDNDLGLILPFVVSDFENGEGKDLPISPLRLAVNLKNSQDDHEEKIRLFYVALTRAEHQMNFMVRNLEDKGNLILENINNFWDLLKFSGYSPKTLRIGLDDIKEISLNVNNHQETVDYQYSYMPLAEPKYEAKTKKRASKQEVKADINIIETGNKLHKIMENISLKDGNLDFIEDNQLKDIASNFLNSELINKYKNYEDYHEYEFYDQDNKSFGVIDLLLVSAKDCVIIDFKLKNIDDEDYLQQLENYRKNIKRIFKREVKCYLYSLIAGVYKEVL